MKVFEKRLYDDGGPNDRGVVIGYVEAENAEEAKRHLEHGFQSVQEITRASYASLKKEAEDNLKMFTI